MGTAGTTTGTTTGPTTGRTGRALVAGTVAAALLASCGGGTGSGTGATGAAAAPAVTATVETSAPAPSVEPPATTAAPADTATAPTVAAPTAAVPPAEPVAEGDGAGAEGLDTAPSGSTGPVQAEPQGEPVRFVAVRVAAQQGFDRVVFEYEGDGVPGYRFGYATEVTQQASGEPVDLPGETGLSGVVRFIDWTSDGNYAGPRRVGAAGTASVTQVDVGVLFEGDQDPYIGVTEEKPFRVTVLEEPTRIVVDVAH